MHVPILPAQVKSMQLMNEDMQQACNGHATHE